MWWQNFDLEQMRKVASMSVSASAPGAPESRPLRSWSKSLHHGAEPTSPPRADASRRGPRTKTQGESRPERGNAFRSSRPASAPALLRGDGLTRHTLADPRDKLSQTRQELEDRSLRETKNSLRKEGLAVRSQLANTADPFKDSTCHDLQVLHNSVTRASSATNLSRASCAPAATAADRGGGGGGRPQSAKSVSLNASAERRGGGGAGGGRDAGSGAATGLGRGRAAVEEYSTDVDQVKKFCQVLSGDINRHCRRMGLPQSCVQDSGAKDILSRMENVTRFVDLMKMTAKARGSQAHERETTVAGVDLAMTSQLRQRFAATSKPPANPSDMQAGNDLRPEEVSDSQSLKKLAQFFVTTGLPLRQTLRSIDKNGHGHLRIGDWESGLEALGWSGDAAQAFRLLDTNQRRVLTLKEVEVKLSQQNEQLAGSSRQVLPGVYLTDGAWEFGA